MEYSIPRGKIDGQMAGMLLNLPNQKQSKFDQEAEGGCSSTKSRPLAELLDISQFSDPEPMD